MKYNNKTHKYANIEKVQKKMKVYSKSKVSKVKLSSDKV